MGAISKAKRKVGQSVSGVFLAVGSENIENFGRLESGSFMFDAAIDDNAVAGMHLPAFAFGLKEDASADDVDHLMMGMAVARAFPTFLKGVTHEHDMRVVREDLTDHPRLGSGNFGGIGGRVNDSRSNHRICLKRDGRMSGEPQTIGSPVEPAAVHYENVAVDVVAGRGGKKDGSAGEVIRLSPMAGGDALKNLPGALGIVA